jgi:membrane protein HdeD
MTRTALERRRTGGDVVIGALLVLAALYVFGNVALATKISVLVLGWTALISGVAMVVGTLVRARSGASWSLALGGVVLAVFGLFLLRNLVAGALTLTLVAGALLLTTGLTRVVGALGVPEARGVLLVSGLASAALGLFVLLNLATATFTLLGILLGTQMLIDGVTLIAAGRLRPTRSPAPTPAVAAGR